MPLIKPLEVIFTSHEFGIINARRDYLVLHLRQICVVSNTIYGEAGSQDIAVGGTTYPANNAGPYFALLADGSKPKWFVTEAAMRESPDGKQLGSTPLVPIETEYEQFGKSGVCKWKP